jgi:hypothetical protein
MKLSMFPPVLLAVLLMGSIPAWADLITVGDPHWKHSGLYFSSADNPIIILDTQTGLGWLDMNAARGLIFNTIDTQTGPGGKLEGFRIANKDEVMTLFADAGLFQQALVFKSLFDPTAIQHCGPDDYRWVITAMYYPGSSIEPNSFPLAQVAYNGSSSVGEIPASEIPVALLLGIGFCVVGLAWCRWKRNRD